MAETIFDAVAGSVNGEMAGKLLHYKEYQLPSSVSVSANGLATALYMNDAGLPAGADPVCAKINTYNQANTPNLIPFISRWYSTVEVKVFNPTSSAITMPAGLGVVIYYKM